MTPLVPLESRREIIRRLALGLTAAGGGILDLEAAQHVHHEASAEKKNAGAYKVKAFTPNEYKTIQRLAAIIVPADEVSGSAVDAGAPEFIDTLASQNPRLAQIFHGGLAWFDTEMLRRHDKPFVDCPEAEQTAFLDLLIKTGEEERARQAEQLVYERAEQYRGFNQYTVDRASDHGPGIRFFDWIRRMTVDAFYTSVIGVKDLNYLGNKGASKYVVPQECIDYALKRGA